MRERLDYFYMAEKNWKKVYTTRGIFSRFDTEWEHWQPMDDKMKDMVRTHWLDDAEPDKIEVTTYMEGVDEKEWWDKGREAGYTSEQGHVDWDLDPNVEVRDIGGNGK
jgi:hypothetical protein